MSHFFQIIVSYSDYIAVCENGDLDVFVNTIPDCVSVSMRCRDCFSTYSILPVNESYYHMFALFSCPECFKMDKVTFDKGIYCYPESCYIMEKKDQVYMPNTTTVFNGSSAKSEMSFEDDCAIDSFEKLRI